MITAQQAVGPSLIRLCLRLRHHSRTGDGRILAQDLLMEPPDVWGRVDAQLVAQARMQLAEGSEGFGLPPAEGERTHELAAGAFIEGVVLHHLRQLAEGLLASPTV